MHYRVVIRLGRNRCVHILHRRPRRCGSASRRRPHLRQSRWRVRRYLPVFGSHLTWAKLIHHRVINSGRICSRIRRQRDIQRSVRSQRYIQCPAHHRCPVRLYKRRPCDYQDALRFGSIRAENSVYNVSERRAALGSRRSRARYRSCRCRLRRAETCWPLRFRGGTLLTPRDPNARCHHYRQRQIKKPPRRAACLKHTSSSNCFSFAHVSRAPSPAKCQHYLQPLSTFVTPVYRRLPSFILVRSKISPHSAHTLPRNLPPVFFPQSIPSHPQPATPSHPTAPASSSAPGAPLPRSVQTTSSLPLPAPPMQTPLRAQRPRQASVRSHRPPDSSKPKFRA